MVRQEDGKKIHQQREESQETQAEDDGRSSAAQTALITVRGEEPGPISWSGGGTQAAFMSVIGLLFLASSVAAVDAVVGYFFIVVVDCVVHVVFAFLCAGLDCVVDIVAVLCGVVVVVVVFKMKSTMCRSEVSQ